MGYMRHHAIIVTGWPLTRLNLSEGLAADPPLSIEEAHKVATEIFGPLVSPIIPARINAYHSFCIAPDGSKEGWSESDEGDAQREAFKQFLNEHRYEDGSGIDWVEVQFGDDDLQTVIMADSDAVPRARQGDGQMSTSSDQVKIRTFTMSSLRADEVTIWAMAELGEYTREAIATVRVDSIPAALLDPDPTRADAQRLAEHKASRRAIRAVLAAVAEAENSGGQ